MNFSFQKKKDFDLFTGRKKVTENCELLASSTSI